MPRRSSRPDPLVKAGRYALTLDFLFRSPGAAKGAGQRLMTSLTADWRRHNAIVIGYPATKGLIRFYVELGARRDYLPGQGNGNAVWPSTPHHQRNGQVEPDHPHLPACTHWSPLSERPGQGAESMARGGRLAASNRRALRYM